MTGEELRVVIYARHSMALSSEGFSLFQHLLLHGASFCNGHLGEPVTLTSVTKRW